VLPLMRQFRMTAGPFHVEAAGGGPVGGLVVVIRDDAAFKKPARGVDARGGALELAAVAAVHVGDVAAYGAVLHGAAPEPEPAREQEVGHPGQGGEAVVLDARAPEDAARDRHAERGASVATVGVEVVYDGRVGHETAADHDGRGHPAGTGVAGDDAVGDNAVFKLDRAAVVLPEVVLVGVGREATAGDREARGRGPLVAEEEDAAEIGRGEAQDCPRRVVGTDEPDGLGERRRVGQAVDPDRLLVAGVVARRDMDKARPRRGGVDGVDGPVEVARRQRGRVVGPDVAAIRRPRR
jgi:hypothetical protein